MGLLQLIDTWRKQKIFTHKKREKPDLDADISVLMQEAEFQVG